MLNQHNVEFGQMISNLIDVVWQPAAIDAAYEYTIIYLGNLENRRNKHMGEHHRTPGFTHIYRMFFGGFLIINIYIYIYIDIGALPTYWNSILSKAVKPVRNLDAAHVSLSENGVPRRWPCLGMELVRYISIYIYPPNQPNNYCSYVYPLSDPRGGPQCRMGWRQQPRSQWGVPVWYSWWRHGEISDPTPGAMDEGGRIEVFYGAVFLGISPCFSPPGEGL